MDIESKLKNFEYTFKWSEEDQVVIARVPELGIVTHGENYIDAIEMVSEATRLRLESIYYSEPTFLGDEYVVLDTFEHFLVSDYDIFVSRKEGELLLQFNGNYGTEFVVIIDDNKNPEGREARISLKSKYNKNVIDGYAKFRMKETLKAIEEIRSKYA